MSALLDVHVRRKHYGDLAGRPVLEDVHLSLERGEVVTLVGASGCGKSTLLRIAAGLEAGFEGRREFDGRTLGGLSRDIGVVFQEPRLFPWLTVAENVAFEAGGTAARSPQVDRLLAEVGLAGYGPSLPKHLSGGQAQRVAIARGLFSQPRVMLLDEPFSAVDAFTRMRPQDLIIELARRHQVTLLVVTHDVDEACVLSDRVLVMRSTPGRVHREIEVALPRPRERGSAAFAALKAQVLGALQEGSAEPRRGALS